MRIACLLVPDLPLAAELRAHPELAGRPVAIAAGPGPRAELIAVSPEAARLGVHPPATAIHARAACAEIVVRVASPARDRAARHALVDVALSTSPRVAPAPRRAGAYAAEAAVLLDASGVDALFRSEAGFAAAATARARNLGLPAVAAVASSSTAAHIAARTLAATPGAVRVLPPGSEAAFLAPLPLDLLDPDAGLAESLTRFGLRRMGDLAHLPRGTLATRLGPQAPRLAALARGEEDLFYFPERPSQRLEEATDLEWPVDRLEPLAFVLRGLLSRLAARLGVRGLACGDLELNLALEGGRRDARRIGVGAPTLDVRVLMRLACLAFEAQPPEAPVEAVALATEGRPVRTDQLDLFQPAGPAPAALARTLAELEALCGAGRTGAPAVADDHRPDAFDMRPFAPSTDVPRSPRGGESPALALRALRPPVPAQVQCAGGRPQRIRSAVANGHIVGLAGPWRTTGGWWSTEGRFAVDHFDVQTSDGSVIRLRFDAIRRVWHVDGLYD